jgi:hypothetical protein
MIFRSLGPEPMICLSTSSELLIQEEDKHGAEVDGSTCQGGWIRVMEAESYSEISATMFSDFNMRSSWLPTKDLK